MSKAWREETCERVSFPLPSPPFPTPPGPTCAQDSPGGGFGDFRHFTVAMSLHITFLQRRLSFSFSLSHFLFTGIFHLGQGLSWLCPPSLMTFGL